MACQSQTIAGIVNDCLTSKGGIRRVAITTTAPEVTVSGGTITQITGGDWYDFYFKKNTANMTSTLNVDSASGVNYVSTDLVLQFSRMETVKRTQIAALALADMWVLVEDCNGQYHYLGFDEPVVTSAATGQTGTNKTDLNGYNITLQDVSDSFPYFVVDTIAKAIMDAAKSE